MEHYAESLTSFWFTEFVKNPLQRIANSTFNFSSSAPKPLLNEEVDFVICYGNILDGIEEG